VGKNAPQPDPMQGFAAIMQAQVGMQWLDFSREMFGKAEKRQRELIDPIIKRSSESQMRAQENANIWAEEDRARYKSIFLPLQDKFIDTAQNWDSPERQRMVAAEAKADVLSNAEAQKGAMRRQMASVGVNPASGRWSGIERQAGVETGLAAAGAQNMARSQTRREAIALKGDALNIGRGLPSQSLAALGGGVSAGNAAVSGNIAGQQVFLDSGQIMDRGFNGAMQGWRGMGDSLNDIYKNKLSAWQTQQQGIGSLAGGVGQIAGLIFSSKDAKEDKRPARGVLEAVKNMPVEGWRYKEGVEDSGAQEHVGPYAEDFKRETGLGDGKTISVVDAIGVTMGAVKELAEKVDAMESAPARGKSITTARRPSAPAKGRSIMKEAA